jgi:prophage tail gpP-like protein
VSSAGSTGASGVSITVGGSIYSGWQDVRITRDIEAGASDFELEVTERWSGQDQPWQIALFSPCTIAFGSATMLTGYIERYEPSYNKDTHTVRIAGRSKTCDVIDCMPDINGSFNGQTLDAIARAIASPFGVNVIVQCDVGAAFPQAVMEKTETAHSFLEKLARMRQVLVTDDENGNLVLTQAGLGGTATGSLTEGGNILEAHARLSCSERYQTYNVLGQQGENFDGGEPQDDIQGSASDSGCQRARVFAEHAEVAVNQTLADARAQWRAAHNIARGTEATISTVGWYQDKSKTTLWLPNQNVPVVSPMLELDMSLVTGKVTWRFGAGGHITEMALMPPNAFLPEPTDANAGSSNVVWTAKPTGN